MSSIEKVAEKILPVILKNFPGKFTGGTNMTDHGHEVGTLCCVYKHSQDSMEDRWANSLKYDVIRMLIRGTDYSHALCLHVCDGSSEFHVYSKKGWLSFCPEEGALIITGGDQIQVHIQFFSTLLHSACPVFHLFSHLLLFYGAFQFPFFSCIFFINSKWNKGVKLNIVVSLCLAKKIKVNPFILCI